VPIITSQLREPLFQVFNGNTTEVAWHAACLSEFIGEIQGAVDLMVKFLRITITLFTSAITAKFTL
jgi:hypothetical protein